MILSRRFFRSIILIDFIAIHEILHRKKKNIVKQHIPKPLSVYSKNIKPISYQPNHIGFRNAHSVSTARKTPFSHLWAIKIAVTDNIRHLFIVCIGNPKYSCALVIAPPVCVHNAHRLCNVWHLHPQ